MGSSLTDGEKLRAIMDLVFDQPFTRTTSTGPDGETLVSYSVAPAPTFVAPNGTVGSIIERLFASIKSALVGPVLIHKVPTIYRKFAIVRNGTTDYLALEETTTIPGTPGFWSTIRLNTKGPTGDPGEDTSTHE